MADAEVIPFVSVIIPSVNGLPTLSDCITSFLNQSSSQSLEIIVVDRCGAETRDTVRSEFPQVIVVPVDHKTPIPQMRAIGFNASSARMIAFTEDHCLADRNWLAAVESCIKDDTVVVGGPVENGCQHRLVDWSVFFCEYVNFMEPVPDGPVPFVAGNNCVISRALVAQVIDSVATRWEYFWHERLSLLGATFVSVPAMRMLHKKSFGFYYFICQRFHFARSFSAMRAEDLMWVQKVIYSLSTTLLPFVIMKRITFTTLQKGHSRSRLLLCFPILCTFLLAWAIGEAIGALFGGGDSLRRVE